MSSRKNITEHQSDIIDAFSKELRKLKNTKFRIIKPRLLGRCIDVYWYGIDQYVHRFLIPPVDQILTTDGLGRVIYFTIDEALIYIKQSRFHNF